MKRNEAKKNQAIINRLPSTWKKLEIRHRNLEGFENLRGLLMPARLDVDRLLNKFLWIAKVVVFVRSCSVERACCAFATSSSTAQISRQKAYLQNSRKRKMTPENTTLAGTKLVMNKDQNSLELILNSKGLPL